MVDWTGSSREVGRFTAEGDALDTTGISPKVKITLPPTICFLFPSPSRFFLDVCLSELRFSN